MAANDVLRKQSLSLVGSFGLNGLYINRYNTQTSVITNRRGDYMPKLPKDASSRVVSTRAKNLVVYNLNAEFWEWHELTGTDHGTDIIIELVENEEYSNKKIEGQIKGRSSLKILKDGSISFDMDVKTINYALGSVVAFVLFLVDITEEIVYYLPIQDYFIANPHLFESAEHNCSTVNLHIPPDNIVCNNDNDLREIAKSAYAGGSSKRLRKVT